MERTILRKVRSEDTRLVANSDLRFNHVVAEAGSGLIELSESEIELQTKSLILAVPQIGGVVGIGVQSEHAHDPVRSLVIESILTTLLNVVGSVKAIYKYTKDLEYYSTRDHLTDLYNQRAFWEFIGYEVCRAERHHYHFSLLVIDIDNFKNINDTWGHPVGDKYLSAFASKVHDVLRKGDIFARYGGDEFALILPETDEAQAFLVARRIIELAEELIVLTVEGSKVKATVSIGMAVFPTHAANEKDLFLFADNMTYKAKGEGKNQVILPTGDDVIEVFREVGEKTRLVMEALEEKRLVPYFQPIASLNREGLECFEVLCRIEKDGRLIPAGEFIEIAEHLGVVSRIDLILLEKAFALSREKGFTGCLFMNLSPKSVILREFIPEVIKLAGLHGIDHGRIIFELTERETVKNLTLLDKFVHELKFQGFKFAIDDFGSGFSSFQYIRRFPIDFVKIEGDFVRNMLVDKKDMAFVKTLSVLAREFGISTIAECIESRELLAAAQTMGIDYAQGYYVGYPSPDLSSSFSPTREKL